MTEPDAPVPTPPQEPVGGSTQPPYPYWGVTPPMPGPRNGLGIASLVTAAVALVSFWTIIGGVILGVVAVVVGFAALKRVKHGQANNKGVAIGGIALGVVAVIVNLIFAVPFFAYENCLEHAVGRGAYAQC